jgi:hypothetical protein
MSILRVLALAALGLSLAQPPLTSARAGDKGANPIVECRVRLSPESDAPVILELRIKDPKLIQTAVEQPLAAAKPDPRPADYQIRGSVTMVHKNGKEESFWLYNHWGHIKYKDTPQFAELGSLRKVIAEEFKWQVDHLP